jgi:hypothetical protein
VSAGPEKFGGQAVEHEVFQEVKRRALVLWNKAVSTELTGLAMDAPASLEEQQVVLDSMLMAYIIGCKALGASKSDAMTSLEANFDAFSLTLAKDLS